MCKDLYYRDLYVKELKDNIHIMKKNVKLLEEHQELQSRIKILEDALKAKLTDAQQYPSDLLDNKPCVHNLSIYA